MTAIGGVPIEKDRYNNSALVASNRRRGGRVEPRNESLTPPIVGESKDLAEVYKKRVLLSSVPCRGFYNP